MEIKRLFFLPASLKIWRALQEPQPKPFPTVLVEISASGMSVIVAGLLFYSKKRRR